MDQRINYYVSKKNACTWISAVSLVISVVLRLINAGMYSGAANVWGLVVLPVFATVLFLVQMLCEGDEHFYRTSVPAFLFCLYLAIKVGMGSYHLAIRFIFWIACIGVAYIYIHTVCGKSGKWLILMILLAFLVVYVYLNKTVLFDHVWDTTLTVSPDFFAVLGSVFAILAMEVHLDGKYHPSWGDRADGRRVRTLSPMTTVTPFIMPSRNGAANCITDSLEITEIEKYIVQKRREGYKSFGITHIFIAAYVRSVAKYPAINRFCSGQRIYSRGDDIQFCMVVKGNMTVDSDESIVKLHLKPTDTVFDVYEKLNEEIKRIKTTEIGSSDFDKVEKLLSITPRPVLALAMLLLRLLDYLGWIPKALLEISPFHASFFLTSMASLGIEPVVHHLYDFGNLPVFCSIGTKYKVNEPDLNPLIGVHCRHYINYTFNTDERICDGFLYASVFKYMKKLLAHPEILEAGPEEVVQDIP